MRIQKKKKNYCCFCKRSPTSFICHESVIRLLQLFALEAVLLYTLRPLDDYTPIMHATKRDWRYLLVESFFLYITYYLGTVLYAYRWRYAIL